MTDLNLTEKIILIFAAVLILVNLAASIKKLIINKKFYKSQIILRLNASVGFCVVFVVLFTALIIAAWFYIQDYIIILSVTAALGFCIMYMLVLQFSVSGITKEGLFVSGRAIEWHNIYDFYIDKNHRKVIFSSNVKGGLTLKGLTSPLKYKEQDEEPLEKYLDGLKSKYLKRIVIR